MILRVELKNPSFFPTIFWGFQRYCSILAVISMIWIGWFVPFFLLKKSRLGHKDMVIKYLLSSNPLSPEDGHPGGISGILSWKMFASQNFMVDVFYFDGKKGQLQKWVGTWPRRSMYGLFAYNYYRWWFEICFIFTPTWRRFPFWLIFFKWLVYPPTRLPPKLPSCGWSRLPPAGPRTPPRNSRPYDQSLWSVIL